MADNQVTPKALSYIDGMGLRQRVHFAMDPESRAIDGLGLRRPNPEPIEEGVPHPTTYLIDREGTVRFVDVREDFRLWLDPSAILSALARLPTR
ncbi:MAG: hypothetical protein AAF430_24810 [Myxococcota bacterium]